jgi:thymidine kinase
MDKSFLTEFFFRRINDSEKNKFGSILDLIPYSNTCTKINAACILCLDGTPALFSYRNENHSEQILIGSTDKYMSLCRKHYLELSKNV